MSLIDVEKEIGESSILKTTDFQIKSLRYLARRLAKERDCILDLYVKADVRHFGMTEEYARRIIARQIEEKLNDPAR